MPPFHICLHARPQDAVVGGTVEIEGQTIATLAIRPDTCGTPFNVTFEVAAEVLARLPRMFVEPDGSFVWVSESAEPRWQIDGSLYDRGGRLLYVELKGRCPEAELDRLLEAFGWPETQVVVQLVQLAAFIDEQTFRQIIKSATSRG